MPCYDSRDNVAASYLAEDVIRLQDKCNKLTRLLCIACAEIVEIGRNYKGIYPGDDELREWYRGHQKLDRNRARAKDPLYLSSSKRKRK